MADDWPLTRLDADRPIALALLSDLQSNLWASLRHTLDLDRVTLAALWLSNLGGMVLTVVSGKHWLPLTATVGALGVVDYFIHRIFRNSRDEARRLVFLLTEIYTDHGLGSYFDQLREDYFVERYRLRLALCPILFALAVGLGLAFGLGT
ncbi:MAG TPA: hypothetical protein VH879_05975 [Gemmatimonadales bacterium]|jgi:hypothetical protein